MQQIKVFIVFIILVAALIENEKETNILNVFKPPQFKNISDTSDTISFKADISCKWCIILIIL